MKTIYRILFAATALLTFAQLAKAQDDTPPYVLKDGLAYSKTISEPTAQGIYTITLESFVTGSVTITTESAPADIVLVLDLSQSMTSSYNSTTRLEALQTALSNFLEVIYHNDNFKDDTNDNPRETPLGNRVSIVTFAGGRNSTTVTRVRSELTDVTNADGTKNTSIISYIMGLNTGGGTNGINRQDHYGTYSDEGMDLANGVLNGISADRKEKSSRTVVLFTDGAPGEGPNWTTGNNATNSVPTSNRCIAAAYTAKNTHTATVFTVILGSIANDDMRNYLQYTSSNYPKATSLTSSGDKDPKGDYAKEAGNDLSGVFTTIAHASGGSDIDLSGTTVSQVDVVSASFTLPPGADESSISVYTAECTGRGDDGFLTFGSNVPVSKTNAITIDDDIKVTVDASVTGGKKDRITVNGFNYSDNFCGEDESSTTGFHGYKVVLEIPIMMDGEAVGGPDVATNAPGSGIYIQGQEKPLVEFVSPKVSLPVNLFINKQGLDVGESAKFRIERTTNGTTWEPVTSVFVTRRSGQTDSAPITKVVGLPSTDSSDKPYNYRIVEEDWSWSYTSKALTPTTSDELVTNPFIFVNSKKSNIDTNIRHAESKATNTFKENGGATYDDSKTNTRSK